MNPCYSEGPLPDLKLKCAQEGRPMADVLIEPIEEYFSRSQRSHNIPGEDRDEVNCAENFIYLGCIGLDPSDSVRSSPVFC